MSRSSPLLKKTSRQSLKTLLVAAGALAFGLTTLEAANSISLNFGTDRDSSSISSGNTAGAIPVTGDNWNNLSGETGTASALLASDGTTTNVSVTWTSSVTWYSGSTQGTGNGQLTKGYLDDGGTGANIVVSGIEYFLSNVYVITASDQSDPYTARPVTVNGVSYTGTDGGTILGTSSWSPVKWTAADTLTEGNGGSYLKISDVAAGTITIHGSTRSGNTRGSIAGVQIENAYSGNLLYWDGGAAGTWDAASSAWLLNGAGAAQAWGTGTSQIAVFSGNTAISISGAQTAEAIWLKTGELSLNDGVLNMSGLAILRADADSTLI
jgi:hypothetical protein